MVKRLSCCHLLSSTFSVKSEQRSCRKTLALLLSQSGRGNKEKDRGVWVPDDRTPQSSGACDPLIHFPWAEIASLLSKHGARFLSLCRAAEKCVPMCALRVQKLTVVRKKKPKKKQEGIFLAFLLGELKWIKWSGRKCFMVWGSPCKLLEFSHNLWNKSPLQPFWSWPACSDSWIFN